MGFKSSSAKRMAASSAVAGTIVVLPGINGTGPTLSGGGITANTVVKTQVVAVGSNTSSSTSTTSSLKITNVYVTDSSYNILDDTALSPSGGYLKIVGTGFATGCASYINGTSLTTTFISSTEIRVVVPSESVGAYSLMLFNTDGNGAIYLNLSVSNFPTFTTTAGSLGSYYEANTISNTISATGDATLIYSLYSGSLPSGATLSSSGVITGTSPLDASSTTYSFVVNVKDAQNQDTTRSFSLTINTDPVTWATPTSNQLITAYEYTPISNVTLSASSAAGKTISYSANTLPGGITLSGNNISGTNNTVGNTYTLLTATAATTGRTATQNVIFNINPDVVTWSSPANNASYSLTGATVMSNVTIAATSAAGKTITYTANALPTGVSLSGNTIYGTPTNAETIYTELTATAATTNRTAKQYISWTISLGDLYWKNTSLLLNGSTSSNTFINDASLNNNQLTIAGDTKPSLFNPYSDGYYSNYFDGTGDYLSLPNNTSLGMGAANFTVEFWMYQTALSSYKQILDVLDGNSAGRLILWVDSGGTLSNLGSSGGSRHTTAGGAIAINTWTHVALVRSSGTTKFYINGMQSGTNYTDSTNYTCTTGSVYIGVNSDGSTYPYVGYLSNFRMVKGTALYTSTFTPSTTPLTAVANTALLTCQSNRFIDNSTNNFAITRNGDTTVSSAYPFTPSNTYATYGSAYFDGTGDYLVNTSSPSVANFGTGDFTWEAWLYFNSTNTTSEWEIFEAQPTAGAFQVYRTTTNALYYGAYGSAGNNVTPVNAIPLFQWFHLALSRTSGTVSCYINGVRQTTVADTTNYNQTGVTIGSRNTNVNPFPGYIADMRIIKGTGIYSGTTITLPTAPLTPVANTQLLTCQTNGGATNQGFYDNSNFNTNNIVTRVGNASQGTFSPYSATGWSYYLDGTGNFQTSAASTTAMFGGTGLITSSSVITIEGWMYETSRDATPDTRSMFGDLTPSSASNNWGLGTNASGYLCFNYYNGSVQTATSSTTVIPLNTWTHFAVVISATSLKLFVNGALQTISGTTTMTGASSTVGYLASGGWNSNTTNNRYLGYLSNVRVLSGTALYSTTFTPPTSPLTAIANTKLLVAQSSGFVDNGPNNFALTLRNTPSVQAFGPFGSIKEAAPQSYSNYFDGTGDYLNVATSTQFGFGTGDFTVEFWAYPTVNARQDWIDITNGTQRALVYYSGSAITFYSAPPNSAAITGPAMTLNTWQHIAVSKQSGSTKMFVNGTQVGSTYASSQDYGTTNAVTIGKDSAGSTYVTGYISNVRIVKGTALYTANTTPSTTPLTAVANTSLLTCQSTTMIDNSTNAFTLTANGDVKPKRFNPFGYTAQSAVAYTPTLHGGSAYFDGTGDYLYNTTALAGKYGTGDFTVEYWVYITYNNGGGFQTHVGRAEDSTSFSFGTGSTLYITQTTSATGGAGATLMSLNQWYHIAWVRIGGTLKGYLNGVQDYSASIATNITTAGWCVGAQASGTYPIGGGYISDVKITNGTGLYTSNFIPPTIPASATATTSLLLSMTGGGIVDAHGSNVLETVGNTQLASGDPYSGTYYSNYSTGASGAYISVPSAAWTTLAGTFTVEFWINWTTTPASGSLMGVQASSGFNMYNDNTRIAPNLYGSANIFSSTFLISSIVLGKWYHIAITRDSSNLMTMWVNGASVGSTTTATTYTQGAWAVFSPSNVNASQGYISNHRVTNTCLYTTAFTPSTTSLTAITGTQLLTCQSNKFVDNSTNAATLTVASTVSVKSMNPFQNNTGKSLYFDGTGDYLTARSNPAFTFGTGAFTIEAWIYPTVNGPTTGNWIYTNFSTATGNSELGFILMNDGTIRFTTWNTSIVSSTLTAALNAWTHVAGSFDGTTYRLFVNGVLSGTATTVQTLSGTGGAYIGSSGVAGISLFTGYMKDLRITKGYARYTANTTPPTATLDIK